ncbi:hypothetical protein B0H13DRAFT_1859055 [Mycena leptocephala]|nr:hypothetical protein B0H13DRAFT_1859055 [Mycena leptocephala]
MDLPFSSHPPKNYVNFKRNKNQCSTHFNYKVSSCETRMSDLCETRKWGGVGSYVARLYKATGKNKMERLLKKLIIKNMAELGSKRPRTGGGEVVRRTNAMSTMTNYSPATVFLMQFNIFLDFTYPSPEYCLSYPLEATLGVRLAGCPFLTKLTYPQRQFVDSTQDVCIDRVNGQFGFKDHVSGSDIANLFLAPRRMPSPLVEMQGLSLHDADRSPLHELQLDDINAHTMPFSSVPAQLSWGSSMSAPLQLLEDNQEREFGGPPGDFSCFPT